MQGGVWKRRNFIYVSSHSSAGALIGDTVNWSWQLTQIMSSVGCWGEGKSGVPEKSLSVQSGEPTNSTHIIMMPSLEIELGPHWCSASLPNILLLKYMVSQGSELLLGTRGLFLESPEKPCVKLPTTCFGKPNESFNMCSNWLKETRLWSLMT